MKLDDRKEVFAQLRRIYDGRLHKEFGTDEEQKAWEGRITLLVAATPDVDRQYSVFQSLGERFVMVREPRSGQQAAIAAMNQDPELVRRELREAVHAVLTSDLGATAVEVPRATLLQFSALAEFTVRARTPVPRSGYNKELHYFPQAESPTRLSQQLQQLGKALALLHGRDAISEEDYKLVRRVAVDSIPDLRRRALARGAGLDVVLPTSTFSNAKEDLQLLGLFEADHLSDLATHRMQEAGLSIHELSPRT